MPVLDEEHVVKALHRLYPADVVQSQRLLLCFRAFFSRGSAQDIYELVPAIEDSVTPTSDPSLRTGSDKGLSRPPSGKQRCGKTRPRPSTRRSSGSSHGRSTHTDSPSPGLDSPSTQSEEAWEYFSARVPSQQRVHGLMRVLEATNRAPRQSSEFYKEIWSTHKAQVFGKRDAKQSRISRLFQGRKVIEQEQQRFECAGRLSLIFLAHDIDVVKNQEWKLGPGQSRQHAAVISIASHLGIDPEEIKKEWRRSRNYMRLLEDCGPASLLELGSGVNWYWEKSLTKEDVNIFIEYRNERMPHLMAQIEELNRTACEMMFEGMLAYGWTEEEMIHSDSRLCRTLAARCPDLFEVSAGVPVLASEQHDFDQDGDIVWTLDEHSSSMQDSMLESSDMEFPMAVSYGPCLQQWPTMGSSGHEVESNLAHAYSVPMLDEDLYFQTACF